MRTLILSLLILFLPFSAVCFAGSKQKSTTKDEVKEVKLTPEQRVEKMAKYIEMNDKEKSQVLNIFKIAKTEKDKIKAANYPKKAEKEKMKLVKATQKEKIKNILGTKRFSKYDKLKDKDIL